MGIRSSFRSPRLSARATRVLRKSSTRTATIIILISSVWAQTGKTSSHQTISASIFGISITQIWHTKSWTLSRSTLKSFLKSLRMWSTTRSVVTSFSFPQAKATSASATSEFLRSSTNTQLKYSLRKTHRGSIFSQKLLTQSEWHASHQPATTTFSQEIIYPCTFGMSETMYSPFRL